MAQSRQFVATIQEEEGELELLQNLLFILYDVCCIDIERTANVTLKEQSVVILSEQAIVTSSE